MPLKSETEGARLVVEKGGRFDRRANIERAARAASRMLRIEFFNGRIVQSFVSFGNYRFYVARGDPPQR